MAEKDDKVDEAFEVVDLEDKLDYSLGGGCTDILC